MGDEANPKGGPIAVEAPKTGSKTFSRSPARTIADNLLNKCIIGDAKMRGPRSVRFVPLESNNIFSALVELYSQHFKANWRTLEIVLAPHTVPDDVEPYTYLARVYVSHWFLDLYVSIRDACTRHEFADVITYYDKQLSKNSTHYDAYLTTLLHSLKPTHIVGQFENFLYVPLVAPRFNWNSQTRNYFNITNYIYQVDIFTALMRTFKQPGSGWNVETVSNDPNGRPFWLFDWHGDQAYAWFPDEGNFNQDDSTLAFILGVSCTPHLGSRDKDALQQFPNNTVPNPLNPNTYARKIEKRFHGMIEVRTIETGTAPISVTHTVRRFRPVAQQTLTQGPSHTVTEVTDEEDLMTGVTPETESGMILVTPGVPPVPPTRRRPLMEPYTTQEVLTYQANVYRIVDFKYYGRTVRKLDINTRTACHKLFIFKE